MAKYNYTSWRKSCTWKERLAVSPLSRNPVPYPTTKIFDNLAFIGDETVNGFILETSEGPVLIDLMWPGKKYRGVIERGLADLGYKVEDIAAILITHGHIDHYGDVEYFRQKSNAEVYMSEIDYHFGLNFRPSPKKPVPVDVDAVSMTLEQCRFVEDRDDITIGDTTIKAVFTPGHTPGGLSFIFPVYDEGRKHMASLWGGNTVPQETKDIYLYIDSLNHFSLECEKLNVDVELSNHAFVDNTMERLHVIRNITNGVPNPFVIGRDAYKRFERMFMELCKNELQKREV